MNNMERKLNHTKSKLSGVAKQAAGKLSGDEVMELEGRIQSSQADFQKSTDAGALNRKIKQTAAQAQASVAHKAEDVKQSVAKKVNDSLDAHAHKKTK